MATSDNTTSQSTYRPPRLARIWVLIVTAVICVTAFLYYQYREREARFSNANYFRLLSESATRSHENINQLKELILNNNSASAIRSIFPSYKQSANGKFNKQSKLAFSLHGELVTIEKIIQTEDSQSSSNVKDSPQRTSNNNWQATVKISEILDAPRGGYLLHFYVDNELKVISSVGDKSVLSVANVKQLSQLIAKEQSLNWSNVLSSNDRTAQDKPLPLPGYSHYFDTTISAVEYRFFFYPILSDSSLNQLKEKATDMFLVGVLPKQLQTSQENARWNVSALTIILVSLVFVWMMLRLFMLSNHQPVGEMFFRSTMLCSYLLFILLMSFVMAYNERQIQQEEKQRVASQLGFSIANNLKLDLLALDLQLKPYKSFYTSMLNENDKRPLDKKLMQLPDMQTGSHENAKPCSTYFTLQANQLTDDIKTKDTIDTASVFPCHFEQQQDARQYDMWYSPDSRFKPSLVLSTLLLDSDGYQRFPRLYTIESNKSPTQQSLQHRDYFKKVRDQQGWDINLPWDTSKASPAFSSSSYHHSYPEFAQINQSKHTTSINNYYIQRLRNIGDGTRGTTIALPLNQVSQNSNFILAADVELPSVNLTEFNSFTLKDFTTMVVDRDSGDVLFHIDEDRSLIENLYQFGQGTKDIAHRLRTGLNGGAGWIEGFYHGTSGKFLIQPLVVDQWALVIFMPDESLDIYMTNIFLLNVLSISGFLFVLFFIILVIRQAQLSYPLKQALSIPLVIDLRKIMVFSSVLLASIYMSYWIGLAIDRNSSEFPTYMLHSFSFWLVITAVLSCLIWGYAEYKEFYHHSRQRQQNPVELKTGAQLLCLFYIFFSGLVYCYLTKVASIPAGSLQWYYQKNVYPARLNQELVELNRIALSRFPNTITHHQIDALSLLPISSRWKQQLNDQQRKGYVSPTDVQHFSKLVNTTGATDWVERYLLGEASANYKRKSLSASRTFLSLVLLIILNFCWVRFNRRILAVRLYGSTQYLRHIYQISRSHKALNQFETNHALKIELTESPDHGYSFSLLLQQYLNDATPTENLPAHYQQWFNSSPLFKEIANAQHQSQTEFLPNMKILLEKTEGQLHLKMWDIEISLQHQLQRQILLRLLNHCKSLVHIAQLVEVTLYGGFHALQRLCVKDNMLAQETLSTNPMQSTEYFAWAECLMDFDVNVPSHLSTNLDQAFLQNEIAAFPMLAFIKKANDRMSKTNTFAFLRWLNLRDWQKTHKEWATINFILMKAEAIYRYKWESCSAAEKLALYYLVQYKRINPANTQMYEHLALNGLIQVKRGRIRIVNQSFAYFVRHAEDTDTLKNLVGKGDIGQWQRYRMPITLLIVLVIGAIALTSGNSIYMIVASVMGLLGTLGSLANSANMLRNSVRQ
ncbi:hypothetical protein [Neptunicella marina]|uniref:Uncharacterized protein n=1 Tax=Neptunicella marina TaxID=2125989 RepID=A0A8J6IYE6_9ALTE|nr:hypothetical protein [Neptunicella marina]MBC3767595.1 hypothetical protein [Neptunicella marina]